MDKLELYKEIFREVSRRMSASYKLGFNNGYREAKFELISEFLSEFALLEHEIFVKLYNYFLVKLDNPTQKIILEKEYFDNVFRDFRNYTFYPRKEKYEKRLKE